MSVSVVVSSGVVLSGSSALVAPAAPAVKVIGWAPSAPSQSAVTRSRLASATTSRATTSTLRSRTPPAKSRLASHQPLQRQAIQSMPVAFRSSSSGGSEKSLKRVLCYGDSLTAGFCSGGAIFEPYGRSLAEALGAAGVPNEVLVCGHSGGLASDFVAKKDSTLVDVVGSTGKGLGRILSEDGPFDLVIIMAGTNDLGRNAPPKDVLRSIRALHKECHKRGVPTVAVPPPPAPLRSASQEAMRLQSASLIEDWAHRAVSGRVFYQDPAEFVPATPGSGWIWEPDRLHFTPAGSRCLGESLAKVLLNNGLIAAPPLKTLSQQAGRMSSKSASSCSHTAPTALSAQVSIPPVLRSGGSLVTPIFNQQPVRLQRVM